MSEKRPHDDRSTVQEAPAPKHAKFKRAGRKTQAVVRELNYPHGIHPALVPGVSIEDQRVRYGTDKVVFGATAVAIVAFIALGHQ